MTIGCFKGGLALTAVTYQYHHIGIPTTEIKPQERYSPTFKMYTSPGANSHRIQWHRFEDDCPLHALIQTLPHVAFKVNNLEAALVGKTIILDPYDPFEGFRVAMVEIEGAPVEYIETQLSEDEIWGVSHAGSLIYPSY